MNSSDSLHALLRLREAARLAGFEILDTAWNGRNARYTVRCAQGHISSRFASGILSGIRRCKDCDDRAALDALRQAAQSKGGACLEKRYLGPQQHSFQCGSGHVWKTLPKNILYLGSWCPQCANIALSVNKRKSDGLERLRRVAVEKGGKCLSSEYLGNAARYRFQCAKGHQWETEGTSVLRKKIKWCRQCANEAKHEKALHPDGLGRLQSVAIEKGGICLSTLFEGFNSQYHFRCNVGHEWTASGFQVVHGSWCKECLHQNRRLGIEAMREIAKERGGHCLSTQYQNLQTKLLWECHRGHQWHAVPGSVRQGTWCPQCARMNQITNRKSKAGKKYQPTPAGNDSF
jgi:hypothetical protein